MIYFSIKSLWQWFPDSEFRQSWNILLVDFRASIRALKTAKFDLLSHPLLLKMRSEREGFSHQLQREGMPGTGSLKRLVYCGAERRIYAVEHELTTWCYSSYLKVAVKVVCEYLTLSLPDISSHTACQTEKDHFTWRQTFRNTSLIYTQIMKSHFYEQFA